MWRLEQQVIPAEGKKSIVFWWSRKTPGNYLGHVHFLQAVVFPFLTKPTPHSNYLYFGILSGHSLYSKELRCALYFQKCFREINLPVK
jgi:hypothetical protein